MANNGRLAFHNYQSAKLFIQDTLVKTIPKIALSWQNIRIDPLKPHIATIGAAFHEDITTATGTIIHYDGYFSGLAHHIHKRWKLQNAHWSVSQAK